MNWEIFNIIGTVAFAFSGALVALEEKYDLVGVFVLGMVTAFGGGITRNLILGIPMEQIWRQDVLFIVAVLTILVTFSLKKEWVKKLRGMSLFDGVGLIAFSMQGAIIAYDVGYSVFPIVFAAMLTGVGGGIIRDVLSRKRPIVFRDEIYATWSIIIGIIISLGWLKHNYEHYILFGIMLILRMLSVKYEWKMPRRI